MTEKQPLQELAESIVEKLSVHIESSELLDEIKTLLLECEL